MRSMMLSFILCALFVPVCAPRRWRMYDRTRAGGRNRGESGTAMWPRLRGVRVAQSLFDFPVTFLSEC